MSAVTDSPPVHTKPDVTSQPLSSPEKWQKKESEDENRSDIHKSKLRQDGAHRERKINKMKCCKKISRVCI